MHPVPDVSQIALKFWYYLADYCHKEDIEQTKACVGATIDGPLL